MRSRYKKYPPSGMSMSCMSQCLVSKECSLLCLGFRRLATRLSLWCSYSHIANQCPWYFKPEPLTVCGYCQPYYYILWSSIEYWSIILGFYNKGTYCITPTLSLNLTYILGSSIEYWSISLGFYNQGTYCITPTLSLNLTYILGSSIEYWSISLGYYNKGTCRVIVQPRHDSWIWLSLVDQSSSLIISKQFNVCPLSNWS